MHALPASGVFAERFALCEAFASRWCAHGARTAKLLSTERWQGECFSFGVKPSGRDVLGKTGILPVAATPGSYSFAHRRLSRRRPRGSAALPLEALPLTEPLAPRSCHEWQSDRFAIGLARSSLAVRAPCAHPRRSNGKVLGQALPKTRRPQARWGKVSDNH